MYGLLTSTPFCIKAWLVPCSLSTCGYRRTKHATFVIFYEDKRLVHLTLTVINSIAGNTLFTAQGHLGNIFQNVTDFITYKFDKVMGSFI